MKNVLAIKETKSHLHESIGKKAHFGVYKTKVGMGKAVIKSPVSHLAKGY